MKSLEELANIDTSAIAELVPKIILDEVEEAARARRFGRNLVRINDDLVRTKGRSIVIGRRGTLTAVDVSEGSTLSATAISYTSNTITPTKKGVAVHITQEAIEGCELNLIKDAVTEAGIALADKEDKDIMEALLKVTEDKATFSDAGTFNAGAVLTYVDTSVSQVSEVDYYDGKIVATGACTVTYHKTSYSSTYVTDAESKGTLTYESIVSAVTAVKSRKWQPKFIVIHPEALGGILKSQMFIDAAKYGSNEPIVNGEIGKIAGLKVLVTTQIDNGVALVIDPNRAAWMAIRRNLDMKRWDNPATDSIELYFYVEYGVAVTDPDALQLIVNIGPKAAEV